MEDKIILYHLTSPAKLPDILCEGLKPFNGDHCKRINDTSSDIVFLCKKEDIQFWINCFHDVSILIEIDCTSIRPNLRRRKQENAPSRWEYGSIVPIPASCFSTISEINLEDRENEAVST